MKAARNGTKDSLEKTKLAMFRKVSFLQRKETGTETGSEIIKANQGIQFLEIKKIKECIHFLSISTWQRFQNVETFRASHDEVTNNKLLVADRYSHG